MFIHRVDQGQGTKDGSTKGMPKKQAGIQVDVDVCWDGNCDIMLQATFTKSAKVTFGVKHIKLSGRMSILLSPLTTELPVISAIQYGFTNPPDIQMEYSGMVQALTNNLSVVQSALLSTINSTLASMLVLPNRMVMPMDLGSYDYLDVYQPPVGMVRLKAVRGRGFQVLRKMFANDIPDLYCVVSLGASESNGGSFKTTTKMDNCTPCWEDESGDFILYDLDQNIYVECWDEDRFDSDDMLGKASITVRELFMNDGTSELELMMNDRKTGCYITLSGEMFHLCDQVQSLSSLKYEGKNSLRGLYTIVVTRAFDIPLKRDEAATYVQVKYGPGSSYEKKFQTGVIADYPGYDCLNPMYDCAFHVPITTDMLGSDGGLDSSEIDEGRLREAAALFSTDSSLNSSDQPQSLSSSVHGRTTRRRSIVASSITSSITAAKKVAGKNTNDTGPMARSIVLKLIDDTGADGSKAHGTLGEIVISHDDLLRARKYTITETRPIGMGGAKLEFRIILSGLQSREERQMWTSRGMRRSSMGASGRASFATVGEMKRIRVTVIRGSGFPIRKRKGLKKDDVPDVYVHLRLNAWEAEDEPIKSCTWRTRTIKDDTMPQWHESKDFDVDPTCDLIRLDALDENKKGKSDPLGSAEVQVSSLLRKRTMRLNLKTEDVLNGATVTLKCITLDSSNEIDGKVKEGEEEDDELRDESCGPFLSTLSSSLDPIIDSAADDESLVSLSSRQKVMNKLIDVKNHVSFPPVSISLKRRREKKKS